MRRNVKTDVLRMVELAMLLALVIVLQSIGGMIKIGPFAPSLVLIPIVIGSIVIGPVGGAILGLVFGTVVVAQCAMGMDAGGFILWGINPFLTALICLLKGGAAGLVPGLVYRALAGKEPNDGRVLVSSVVASLTAPVINTGLFIIGLSVFFKSTLYAWSGGTDIMLYIITGLVGINFLIEFGINAIVSPAISTIVKVVTKRLYKK